MTSHPQRNTFVDSVVKYRRLLAIAVALLLILSSWFGVNAIASNHALADNAKTSWLSVLTVLNNLASTVIAFYVASLLFATENEQKQRSLLRTAVADALNVPTTLQQVPWVDFIEQASEIDFVVQGWNGWGDDQQNGRALTEFFERGGIFRLYVCNPASSGGSLTRSYMAERIGREPAGVVEEINGTLRSIREARNQSSVASQARSEIRTFRTDQLNWYFAASFKGRQMPGEQKARDVMVFSIYSHTSGRRPWLMPAVVIYPDMQDKLGEWFELELQHLGRGAELITDDGRPPVGQLKAAT